MESQEPSPDPEPEPKPRRKREKDESWREDPTWLKLCCNPSLAGQYRQVLLEYTSELFGESVKARISPQGTWIWRPDAMAILKLGPAASCRGAQHQISRPFYVCQASKKELADAPSGPPKKEK